MARPDTKQRILDAAELLFAERGVGPTSLRAVIAAAGVNAAAIHYHFGSKQAVVEAVFSRWIDPLNQDRLKRLDQLEAAYGDQPVPVLPLLAAFIEPTLSLGAGLGERGPAVGRLVARLHAEPGQSLREIAEPRIRPVFDRFVSAAIRSVPGLTPEEATERLEYVVGGMVRVFAGLLSQPPAMPRDFDAIQRRLDRMVRFAAPGFAAAPEFEAASDSASLPTLPTLDTGADASPGSVRISAPDPRGPAR